MSMNVQIMHPTMACSTLVIGGFPFSGWGDNHSYVRNVMRKWFDPNFKIEWCFHGNPGHHDNSWYPIEKFGSVIVSLEAGTQDRVKAILEDIGFQFMPKTFNKKNATWVYIGWCSVKDWKKGLEKIGDEEPKPTTKSPKE